MGHSGKTRTRSIRSGLTDTQFALLMLLPAVLVVAGALAFPLGFSFWTTLNSVGPNLSMSFKGISNYVDAVHNPFFLTSLGNTLYFAALTVTATVVVGLGMALLLNERFVGRGVLRAIIIIPWAVSQVVVAIIWGWIFNGSFGLLNALLKSLGLIGSYRGWLSDPALTMNLVALAFVWSAVPFSVVIFLASLQSIPIDLYKAAAVDGADAWRRFRHIVLPSLRYAILVVLIVASLDGLLAFTLIKVLTGGGPGTSTTVLSWLGYQLSFLQLDFGQGAAVFYILVVIMATAAAVYIRVLQRSAGEEGA